MIYSPKTPKKKSEKEGLHWGRLKISLANLFGRCGSSGRLMFRGSPPPQLYYYGS
jgi:hypothetical protein